MPRSRGHHAARVAAGIAVTRVLGLVRERVFAHYFGLGFEADAFRAALRIPNIIRNLLGEGTLSASFIPVYASLIERQDHAGARRLAGTLASVVILVGALAAIVGIALAPLITDAVAIGFDNETRELTARLVRILFPMSAVMLLSAWCLGVLNTHRRFFLPYAAPALWNIAQIGTLVALGGLVARQPLVVALAWGALAGSGAQVIVQLPTVLSYVGRFSWNPRVNFDAARQVIRAWIPVIFGAGAMQISALIDTQLASLLGEGAVANLGYAQLIGVLPISLFGISVAAASLPELSRDAARANVQDIRDRMGAGMERVLFFVVPSAVIFTAMGTHVVGPILQTGAFGRTETEAVSAVLAALGVGLPAAALVKLLASGHYALGDTRTPFRISILTVTLGATLAFVLMRRFGVVGIVLGGSAAAYINASLNFAFLRKRLGPILTPPHRNGILTSTVIAIVAGVLGRGIQNVTQLENLWFGAVVTLGTFGVVYLSGTFAVGHPQAQELRRAVGDHRGDHREDS